MGTGLETARRREDLGPHGRRRPGRAAVVGQDRRAGRPARRRHVRRDVRLPADHGPEPPARDHDERHRDDLLPADREGQGAELPRHVGLVRRRRRRDPRPGRRLRRRSPARSWSPAWCWPLVGVLIHFLGSSVLHKVLPPVVTGAVVMLIGFNLAPVVANIYWPQDQWVALLDDDLRDRAARSACAASSAASRSSSRLIFGYVLSWLFDQVFGQITSVRRRRRQGRPTHCRVNFDGVAERRLVRLPAATTVRPTARRSSAGTRPSFSLAFDPARAAGRHRADRREHRPRQGRRRDDRPRPRPRTWAARSPPTASAPSRHRRRRLAHHDVRREHRRHGRHPRLLHGRLLRGRGRRDPLRPLARSSARSSRPPPAACSAASPSCSTA